MNNPILGMHYLIAGFGLIVKPGLKRFVVIPLLINSLLFIGLFFVLRHFIHEFNTWFTHFLPAWLQWMSAIIWVAFFLSFFLLFIFAFVTIANLISAPFNSFLSEKVEMLLTGQTHEERSLWENIQDTPRIIGRQLAVFMYYLPRTLVLLVLFFIPVIQAVAAIFWFLFNAWFMTLTYMDYPMDNHRISFQEMLIKLRKNRWLSLGFGMSVLVTSMIPLVNLIVMPAAVAGATQWWVESTNPSLNHNTTRKDHP